MVPTTPKQLPCILVLSNSAVYTICGLNICKYNILRNLCFGMLNISNGFCCNEYVNGIKM